MSFAKNTNSVLLAATEMAEAAKDYPIVFIGKENGPFTLAAMVGLRDGENLFVESNGQWQTGTYVPAFARRYPFVLAENDEDDTHLTVCVDESCAGLSEEQGEPLFDKSGKESALLQGAVDFLKLFHTEMQRTRQLGQLLSAYGLLEPKVIEINRGGKRQVLDGLYIVNRDKLNALDDEKTLILCRNGAMGWIHAHLISLSHIERMATRLAERPVALPGEPATASAPAISAP
ncbi:SapC family protein [Hydrogenophaga sp. PAMC20947]|uniref:SapC family protein n=1 Tax=Hydrogenophaga sp. PAMC20947 TaxID=2565558 RepID=UPI001FFA2C8E|nr:SapC family protein [Hydrogenophaga sp. PAMC20947]